MLLLMKIQLCHHKNKIIKIEKLNVIIFHNITFHIFFFFLHLFDKKLGLRDFQKYEKSYLLTPNFWTVVSKWIN